jgi:hypothetical protein
MTEEMVNTRTGEIVESVSMQGLAVSRPPAVILEEARVAAKALQSVISEKKKPVKFNGEQYLEYEDWQLVARFYGVTVKVISTSPVQIGQAVGFEAHADAIDAAGRVISSADAMCLNDEDKWSTRSKYQAKKVGDEWIREKVGDEAVPLFQLRSMAQTRACAKCLRNIFAWVVVLAGFPGTPAEDIDNTQNAERAAAESTSDKPTEVKLMKSRFPGVCSICSKSFAKDTEIIFDPGTKKASHPGCYAPKKDEAPAAAVPAADQAKGPAAK